MIEFILRRTIAKHLDKEQQDVKMLQKSQFYMVIISFIITNFLWAFPMSIMLAVLIANKYSSETITHVVFLILVYVVFLIWFSRRFRKIINVFETLLMTNLYSSRYVLRGKAISKEDFNTIKKENETLYNGMILLDVSGCCYHVCFMLLKYLKKGFIKFVAVRDTGDTQGHKYTMHVLYINNGWCYDTYTQRQHPLDEIMKKMHAKVYMDFRYEDVEEKTYEEFREEQAPALAKWCEENDCFQKFLKK